MDTIKSRQEFGHVFSEGRRYSDRFLRITVLSDEQGGAGKVAFVAAKRLGTAPFRNRSKRVLREAARTCGLPRDGVRMILFATRDTAEAPTGQVAKSLSRLMRRAGVEGRGQA